MIAGTCNALAPPAVRSGEARRVVCHLYGEAERGPLAQDVPGASSVPGASPNGGAGGGPPGKVVTGG